MSGQTNISCFSFANEKLKGNTFSFTWGSKIEIVFTANVKSKEATDHRGGKKCLHVDIHVVDSVWYLRVSGLRDGDWTTQIRERRLHVISTNRWLLIKESVCGRQLQKPKASFSAIQRCSNNSDWRSAQPAGLQPERRGEAIQTQRPQPPSQRWTQTNLRTTTPHLSAARKRGNRRQDVRLLLRRVKRYNYNLWNNISQSVAETSGSLRFSQAGGVGPESYSRMHEPFTSHSRSSQPQSSLQAAKKEMDSVKAVNVKKHVKVKKQRIINWRGCGSETIKPSNENCPGKRIKDTQHVLVPSQEVGQEQGDRRERKHGARMITGNKE